MLYGIYGLEPKRASEIFASREDIKMDSLFLLTFLVFTGKFYSWMQVAYANTFFF